MDTDGSVAATQGTIEFSSTSPHMTAAVEYLVASFGGKTLTEGRITQFTDKYGVGHSTRQQVDVYYDRG